MGSARSATLPRQHRRQLSNDSTYNTSYGESREHSPSFRRCNPLHASSTLPRNSSNLRSHSTRTYASSRKTSRSSLSPKINTSNADLQSESPQRLNSEKTTTKADNQSGNLSLECLTPSHTNSYRSKNGHKLDNDSQIRNEINDTSAINKSSIHDLTAAFKNSVSLDNSGPSSIESHKSSVTSGPSSLESHRTVINRPPLSANGPKPTSELKNKRSFTKKKEVTKYKVAPKKTESNKIPHSNSFTLQVTTNNQSGSNCSNNSNSAMTTTINGGSTANTKIYVQNSPVRSVITFENGQNSDSNPNVVIINGSEPVVEPADIQESKYSKNTNSIQSKEASTSLNNSPIVNDHSNLEPMNNSRKLSLQLAPKEGLNYKNLLKNVPPNQMSINSSPESPRILGFGGFTKNSFDSNPPSPTKSYDSVSDSGGNVFTKLMSDSKSSLDKSYSYRVELGQSNNLVEKNILGSEPNISYKDKTHARDSIREQEFPSLCDLSFNFTSLAAQKILKGVSINSIDTLVELNTAAIEKQNNCDVVHTDFGLV